MTTSDDVERAPPEDERRFIEVDGALSLVEENKQETRSPNKSELSCWRQVVAATLFCLCNLINLMDRYTIPAVIKYLKDAFQVDDAALGIIPACFELIYVLATPLMGYLGDRWKRVYIVAISLLIATTSTLASSFVPDDLFPVFVFCKAINGISEAATTCLMLSLIGDYFAKRRRTIVIAIYSVSQMLGSGVGFTSAGAVAGYSGSWRWAFRLTPILFFLVAIGLFALVPEPKRGAAENTVGVHAKTSFTQDIVHLLKTPSFVLSSIGYICFAYSMSAFCYWMPTFVVRMYTMKDRYHENSVSQIGFIFGALAISSAMCGVAAGMLIANLLKKRGFGPASDGIVCGWGMLLTAILTYSSIIVLSHNEIFGWILLFLTTTAMSSTPVLFSTITLNVVAAVRRASAFSLQMLMCHLLGYAVGSYVVGLISDHLRSLNDSSIMHINVANFLAIQTSLLTLVFVPAIGAGLFLLSSLFVNEDSAKIKQVSAKQVSAQNIQ